MRLVLVAFVSAAIGAGAALGIQEWRGGDNERERAALAAEQFASRGEGTPYYNLEKATDGVWRFKVANRCYIVTLAQFRMTYEGWPRGMAIVPCKGT